MGKDGGHKGKEKREKGHLPKKNIREMTVEILYIISE